LDLLRTMQRAIRRADIPVAFSQGFNPHPILSFASALSVGVTSEGEYLDITLEKEMKPEDFAEHMNRFLPKGIRIVEAAAVSDSCATPMAVIDRADYTAELKEIEKSKIDMQEIIDSFFNQESVVITKEGKKGKKATDIRPFVDKIKIMEFDERGNLRLFMRVSSGSKANVRPEQVIDALSTLSGVDFTECSPKIHRLDLYVSQGDKLMTPLEMAKGCL